MRGTGRLLPLAAVLLLSAARAGAAQEARPAEAAPSVLDGVYTAAQAEKGKSVFAESCSGCHSAGQFNGLVKVWQGRTVYDLYEQIRTTMPYDGPGRLSREEYADLIAYIISLNGFPAGKSALGSDPAALKQIRIVERS